VVKAAILTLHAQVKAAREAKGLPTTRTKADRSKLLSKSEYDEQMRQEVEKLKAQGKMPSLEEVLEIFQQVLEEHANRGTIKLHPPRPKGGRS
jgi:hypothetical protein